MLGVGLRKLCPQDSFGYAFREKKAVRKSTPGGCKTGPRGVQNGLREALEAPKPRKIQGFCCISRSATDIVQIVQISPLEGPRRPPRGAQERPGTPQERPRRPQDGSKSAKSVPRAPPEPPKDGFRAALAAKLGPTGAKEPSGGLPQAILDPPRAGFASSGGRFS